MYILTWVLNHCQEIKLIVKSVVGVDEISLIGYILNILIDANEHIWKGIFGAIIEVMDAERARVLKVGQSRKEILASSIIPKNELENFYCYPSLLGQKFFIIFLEELKKLKSPFEINWPLYYSLSFYTEKLWL